MGSDLKRKKYGLPERDYSLPEVGDLFGHHTLLFNADADLVTCSFTVSTDPDQIAIAVGYLDSL